jgi:aminopeptidase N
MKKTAAAGFLMLCCCFYSGHAYAQDYTHAAIDVQHYTFKLLLNDENDLIKGEADISILFLEKLSAFDLDLVKKNAAGRGMTVTAITTAAGPSVFTQDDQRVHISTATNAGDTVHYVIKYEGIPADGLIIDKTQYGRRCFFGDNWPNTAHNWLPCIDNPIDKASVDFIVTAPGHYQVIANGQQIEESSLPGQQKLTHWKETVALPVKVMTIGAADFAVNYAGDTNGVPLYSWVYPENKEAGFYDYAQAKNILPFFIQQVGPYAYRKLANVQSKTRFGGMENASAIFYSEQSVQGNRQAEALMAHEIAHQWFGNSVTEKSWAHVWLSEGFATYMSHLYFERTHGADTFRKRLQEDRVAVIDFSKKRNTPVVDSSVSTNLFELLNANSYQKGGWVLHMLRRKLGDTIFWKGIRTYYASYAGKNAATDDFRKTMEAVSGQDLQAFFLQWLYRGGQPRLRSTVSYDAKKKTAVLSVEQLQSQLFDFPLDISIVTAGHSEIRTMKMQGRKNTITISADGPVTMQLDPETNLLFEQSIENGAGKN